MSTKAFSTFIVAVFFWLMTTTHAHGVFPIINLNQLRIGLINHQLPFDDDIALTGIIPGKESGFVYVSRMDSFNRKFDQTYGDLGQYVFGSGNRKKDTDRIYHLLKGRNANETVHLLLFLKGIGKRLTQMVQWKNGLTDQDWERIGNLRDSNNERLVDPREIEARNKEALSFDLYFMSLRPTSDNEKMRIGGRTKLTIAAIDRIFGASFEEPGFGVDRIKHLMRLQQYLLRVGQMKLEEMIEIIPWKVFLKNAVLKFEKGQTQQDKYYLKYQSTLNAAFKATKLSLLDFAKLAGIGRKEAFQVLFPSKTQYFRNYRVSQLLQSLQSRRIGPKLKTFYQDEPEESFYRALVQFFEADPSAFARVSKQWTQQSIDEILYTEAYIHTIKAFAALQMPLTEHNRSVLEYFTWSKQKLK